MEIQVTYDARDNKILAQMEGDLDLNSVNEFKRVMDEAISTNKTDVSVDCAELRYIDSTGLGVLAVSYTHLTMLAKETRNWICAVEESS